MTLEENLRAIMAEAIAPLRREIAELRRVLASRPSSDEERLLRVKDAAAMAGVSVRTMRAWISAGRVESRLVHGLRRVPEAAVRALGQTEDDAAIDRIVERSLQSRRRRT